MDSARFIRKKSVLASWIIAPLVLAGMVERSAYSVMDRQRLMYARNQTLEKIIPRMIQTANGFNRFIAPYSPEDLSGRSIHDATIEVLNHAANNASLTLASINLKQEQPALAPNATRIDMYIKGSGTPHDITAFIDYIKKTDPLIYENRIVINFTDRDPSEFQFEAILSRIYLNSLSNKRP